MDPASTIEFHFSVYHYFLWLAHQSKQWENGVASPVMGLPDWTTANADTHSSPLGTTATSPQAAEAPVAAPTDVRGGGTPTTRATNIPSRPKTPTTTTTTTTEQRVCDSSPQSLPLKPLHDTTTTPTNTTNSPPPPVEPFADRKPPSIDAKQSDKLQFIADAMQTYLGLPPQTNTSIQDLQNHFPPIVTKLHQEYPSLSMSSQQQMAQIGALQNELATEKSLVALLRRENETLTKRKAPSPMLLPKKRRKKTIRPSAKGSPHTASLERENDQLRATNELQRKQLEKLKPLQKLKPPSKLPTYKQGATFDERVEELKHFCLGNGHCRVPLREPYLGRWVGQVRGYMRDIQNGIPNEYLSVGNRIDQLNELGFVWQIAKPAVPWECRLEDLKRYKEMHGHCNVPRQYKPDPSLGEWVHLQRRYYKLENPILTDQRMAQLEQLGFDWHPGERKITFEERLEQLREYRREKGHLHIPVLPKHNKDEAEDYKEYSFLMWVKRMRADYRKLQRGRASNMDHARLRKLQEIGFEWTASGSNSGPVYSADAPVQEQRQEQFKERIEELRRIKELYGECSSLTTLRRAGYDEKSSLYGWMASQRKHWKNMKAGQNSSLTDERIALLESVGFDFQPRKDHAPYGSHKLSAEDRACEAAKQAVEEVLVESDHDHGLPSIYARL